MVYASRGECDAPKRENAFADEDELELEMEESDDLRVGGLWTCVRA